MISPLVYAYGIFTYQGTVVISYILAEICIFQFTMGLVSQNCPWLLGKPVVNGNAYLDQKIRYYYVSLKLFALTNILKKAISMDLYIYTS